MSNKFKKIILNIFPVTTLYDVVFRLISGVNQVTFKVVETVIQSVPGVIYSVTFRIIDTASNTVIFKVLSSGLNSVTFRLIDVDDSNVVWFNVLKAIVPPSKVQFYIIEGDDDKTPSDCIPLNC